MLKRLRMRQLDAQIIITGIIIIDKTQIILLHMYQSAGSWSRSSDGTKLNGPLVFLSPPSWGRPGLAPRTTATMRVGSSSSTFVWAVSIEEPSGEVIVWGCDGVRCDCEGVIVCVIVRVWLCKMWLWLCECDCVRCDCDCVSVIVWVWLCEMWLCGCGCVRCDYVRVIVWVWLCEGVIDCLVVSARRNVQGALLTQWTITLSN